jgi:hypothetical protein
MGFEQVLDGERTLMLINYGSEDRDVRLLQSASPSASTGRFMCASGLAMAGRLQAAFNTVALEPKGQRLAPPSVQVWDLSGKHLRGTQ